MGADNSLYAHSGFVGTIDLILRLREREPVISLDMCLTDDTDDVSGGVWLLVWSRPWNSRIEAPVSSFLTSHSAFDATHPGCLGRIRMHLRRLASLALAHAALSCRSSQHIYQREQPKIKKLITEYWLCYIIEYEAHSHADTVVALPAANLCSSSSISFRHLITLSGTTSFLSPSIL